MIRPPTRCAWLAVAAGLLGCESAPAPAVRTFALTPPAGTVVAREPHLALDPADPDRVIVAAQYGEGYNRGGRRIWTWTSGDDGRTWTGRDLPLPDANATLAADAVTAFDAGGRGLLLFLYADSAFRGGAALSRTGARDLDFGPASIAARGDIAADGAIDKGWVGVDRSSLSPMQGSVYLSYHVMRLIGERTVEPTLYFRRSGPDGEWSDGVALGTVSGGQFAVRASGIIDVVFLSAERLALLHAASEDGGRTFGPPDTIAVAPAFAHLDIPAIAELSGDTVLVCWGQDGDGDPADLGTRCASGSGDGRWSRPAAPDPATPTWLPAVAAGKGATWFAGYQTDSAETRVVLFRSTDGGRTFTPHQTLASRPFGAARFCRAPAAPCRRDTTRFFPGDYITVAGASGRLAVAFTLPESDDPLSRPTIHVSLLRPE